jgi:hemerythrin-like domain-containing protein
MPHLLATLQNVPFETIKGILEKDKAFHATKEMYLEHIWQHVDDENEVLFLFRINSVENTKKLIEKLHSKALEQNPDANLPNMTYLQ